MGGPIDLKLLKGALETVKDAAIVGKDAVKDWRGENGRRQANAFRHEERMLDIRDTAITQWIGVAKDAVRALADSYAVVYDARTNRKKVDAEIALNYEKEAHAYQLEAEKLSQMAEKLRVDLSEKEKKGAANRENLRAFVEKLQKEYDRYLGMTDKEFLSEEVTKRLSDLRGSIVALSKELMQA